MFAIIIVPSTIHRDKAIKILKKILSNLINNPSELNKYGNLNLQTIYQKLKKCKTAISLLYHLGFENVDNDTRLKWIKYPWSIKAVNRAYDILTSDRLIRPLQDDNEYGQNQQNLSTQLLSPIVQSSTNFMISPFCA